MNMRMIMLIFGIICVFIGMLSNDLYLKLMGQIWLVGSIVKEDVW